MENLDELIQKINILFHHLGIDDPFDVESENVIDNLYAAITNVRKISEFNAMIIHEMIKADLIPPVILKKAELSRNTKGMTIRLQRLSDKYEAYKKNGATKEMLTRIAQEMLSIQKEIDRDQKELDSL